MHLAKALWQCGRLGSLGTFLLPRADYSLWIRFKITAAILASLTCQRFLILRSDSFYWLLHLPGNIELAGSKSRGKLLLTGETPFRWCLNRILLLLLTLAGEFLNPLLLLTEASSNRTLSKMIRIDKLLLLRIKK